MYPITIGADPELFVKKNGVYVSAHGLIKGDKKNPFKVDQGAVQVDGMALEYNIEPCSTKEEFIYRNKYVLSQLKDMVPDYELAISSFAEFSEEYMASQPKEAVELGCDPDYSAWFMSINVPPPQTRPMRTAAGHIHIGFREPSEVDEDHEYDCASLVREMDYYLGIETLIWDQDNTRRSMYGGPACYRAKPYGVEYRTPSNKWLETDELMGFVFDRAKKCTQNVFDNGPFLTEKYHDLAMHIIDRNETNWKELYPVLNDDLQKMVA